MRHLHAAILALGTGLAAAMLPGAPACAADTVRIGTPEASSLAFGALDVGVANGTFARYGIAIDRQDFGGSAKMHPALAGGSLDMGFGSGSDFLFIVRGAPEIAVGVTQKRPNDLLIATRANGPIGKLSDLKGVKMGAAGPGGLTLWIGMSASMKEGWGPKGMQYVFLGGVPAIDAALLSGNVDAVVTDIGAGYRMEAEGRARVLALGGDVVDPFIAHVVFASTDMVQNHADVLRRYLKGMYETIAWMTTHEAETLQMTSARTGYPPEIAHKVYAALRPEMATDGHFAPAAYQAAKRSLVELQVVKPEDMPADSKMYTEAFLP